MLALGLVLLLLGVGGGAFLVWTTLPSTSSVNLSGAGIALSVTPLVLLLSGVVALLLVWLGLRVTAAGARRRRATRRELKELRQSGAARGAGPYEAGRSRGPDAADRAAATGSRRRADHEDPDRRSPADENLPAGGADDERTR
ncbi:MAG: hypothetical protein ACR2JN_10610 [Lapillicoccus sp.]